MTQIEKIVQELPPELRQEVEDFAQFLLDTKVKSQATIAHSRKLRLSWAGGLSEHQDQFTSLELQKKSLDWWDS